MRDRFAHAPFHDNAVSGILVTSTNLKVLGHDCGKAAMEDY